MIQVKPENKDLLSEKIGEESLELQFDDEKLVEQLFLMTEILSQKCSWGRNIRIVNKSDEREKIKALIGNESDFEPDFKFKTSSHDPKLLFESIEQCRSASERIGPENIKDTGFKVIKVSDVKKFFAELFDELELYIKLAHHIEDENKWQTYSEKIWSKPSKKEFKESLDALEDLQPEEEEKDLGPEKLAEMFEEELEKLGVEYTVEIRNVGGCHNIPEEETVVVARGSDGKRMYSKKEAKLLTKHEIFHVVRGINGRKFSDKFGFLGVHTPFYDKTEEGGAVLRERETGTNYEAKDFDYHLRRVAAYRLAETDNFRRDFQDILEELIDLGGSFDRSFYLLTRNREALRHHIYLSGMNEWTEEEREKLLIGKVNPKWAEKFWKEADQNPEFNKPFIGPKKLFGRE